MGQCSQSKGKQPIWKVYLHLWETDPNRWPSCIKFALRIPPSLRFTLQSNPNMLLYSDVLTGDEMFSDAFPM